MKTLQYATTTACLIAAAVLMHSTASAAAPGVVQMDFIYEDANAPTAECHASTIEETPSGVIAAWFGGTEEKDPDVGIWVSHLRDGKWSTPVEVANGVESPEKRYPCWNPVLFQMKDGPLLLFYKVGPDPRTWWGMLITSDDDGKTWSEPRRRLPDGYLGPIKNKPIWVDGQGLLCGSSTEHDGWRLHVERMPDLDDESTWSKTEPLNDGTHFGAIQPTFLRHPNDHLQILSRSRQGRIVENWSTDAGQTWSPVATGPLPNPNSGIDAVTLADGRHLLVYNHTERGRSPINVAVSNDGKTWRAGAVLEDAPGEYSYPAVIQTADGRVHATYTWRREKIQHVVIDPKALDLRDMQEDGAWPE